MSRSCCPSSLQQQPRHFTILTPLHHKRTLRPRICTIDHPFLFTSNLSTCALLELWLDKLGGGERGLERSVCLHNDRGGEHRVCDRRVQLSLVTCDGAITFIYSYHTHYSNHSIHYTSIHRYHHNIRHRVDEHRKLTLFISLFCRANACWPGHRVQLSGFLRWRHLHDRDHHRRLFDCLSGERHVHHRDHDRSVFQCRWSGLDLWSYSGRSDPRHHPHW